MTNNCATADGTARYIDRFAGRAANGHFREAQGLILSSIGIGTYLGNADEATDTNYQRCRACGATRYQRHRHRRELPFQRSERSIGQALKILASDHGIQRDELVICTKGGYLPFDGAPPRDVREYVNQTFVKPGIASFEDIVGGSHCMTPSYLQNQPDQSLRNMDLECVDVYYIHNPESQLGHVSESEFYERLGLAFERLEENRKQGKLTYWRGNMEWFSCSPGFRWSSLARTHVRDRD